ncbi:hypothetical protein GCM10011529_21560 [Polymorphobacter glacialis]|uniref:Uncharacterized protein n=1 Tax=Sandarakinorhabdus glacialis TaxID=1614636 RepID=A0A917E9U5_9SPHN|nr:hypothetical protein [Polymorphobacter glacialis]GGE14837.1 hypothetical protein GCM10011529_21560 [Polymorphobacter glacialis]
MTETPSLTRRVTDTAHAARDWLDSPAGKRAQKWVSIGLSVAILAILARSISDIGWRQVVRVLPTTPLFWILFGAAYFLQPLIDWIIFRRWWPMAWRAVSIFLQKRVMNEALFSYAGDTYLIAWAANKLGIEYDPEAPPKRLLGRGDGPGLDPQTSPFAAIKDVAITSGLAGNLTTLVTLGLALAMGGDRVLSEGVDPAVLRNSMIAFGALIVLSASIVLFRKQVMSIPVADNMWSFWWHLFRVLTAHVLIVLSWVVALPAIAFTTWFLLGALRMVIGRLPLPNKELVFAAVAVSLTGDASVQVAALMAAQGALHLVFHGLAWVLAAAIEKSGPAMTSDAQAPRGV